MLQEFLKSSLGKQSGSDNDTKEKHASSLSSDESSEDTVRLYNFLDDDPEYRPSVAFMTFRFAAVLDVEKLYAALEEVFQLEGYHKLGARIRRNKNGKLEHHIPARYTHDRPSFNWSHETHSMNVEDHPVISRLPDGSKHDIPTMYTGVESWKDPLYPSKKLPSKLDDYLNGDISPITIHIVSFDNATLLTLAFPHVVMDAVAASYLLKTWAAVAAGRRHEIPPFMQDGGKDLVKEIVDSGKTPSSKHILYKQRLTGFPLIRFFGSLISDWFWYPEQEWRFLCLPPDFVSQLKTEAISDCGGQYLSEGDVLAAWRNRIIAKACNWRLDKSILMLQYYSLHGVLEELPPGKAFIGNWVAKIFVQTTAKDVVEGSIGRAALHIRNSLKEQRTREQAEAFVTMQSQQNIMMFGEGGQAFVGLSNISRAGLNKLDFSGAVLGAGNGTPVHLHSDFFVSSSLKLRNVGPLFGQDASGNWWISWVMRSEAWPRVEHLLAVEAGIRVVDGEMQEIAKGSPSAEGTPARPRSAKTKSGKKRLRSAIKAYRS